MRIRKLSIAFVMCGIMGTLLASSLALAAPPEGEGEVTEQNWEHHPEILEIRKLYGDIQSKLESGKLKYQKKSFARLPRSCRGMYPREYLAIATDRAGRVRMYTAAQRISHDDLLTTRHYYDEGGHLRFVYRTNESSEGFATIHNRVYLNEQGKVFWDVESEAKQVKFGEITRDPAEIGEITSAGILDDYNKTKVECSREKDAGLPSDPAHIENAVRAAPGR